MTDHAPHPESLFGSVVDDRLSGDDFAALERRLLVDDSFADDYLRFVDLHAELSLRASKGVIFDQPGEQVVALVDTRRRSALRSSVRPFRRRTAPLAVAAAFFLAAAAVAIYLFVINQKSDIRDPKSDTLVAMLIDRSDGATVIVNGDIANTGDDYGRGEYAIEAGTAQFMLTNKAVVTLRGKTQIVMHGPMGATLKRGTATFHCPPDAIGYTLTTPRGVRVIDLGTDFDVIVDSAGNATVRVTHGRVEVSDENASPIDPATKVHDLAAGQSIRWIDGRFVLNDSDLAEMPGDHVVNVDFGPGPAYTGTGVAARDGKFWNRVVERSATELRTSDGAIETPIRLTTTAPSHGQIPGQGVGLLDDYVFKHVGGDGWSIYLDGLDDAQAYDLVVYCATGYQQGSTFVVGDQASPVSGDSTAKLADGVNYVRFTAVLPTNGRIEINVTDPDRAYVCNGLQIVAREPLVPLESNPTPDAAGTADPPHPEKTPTDGPPGTRNTPGN